MHTPDHSELGKSSQYDATYNPDKLFPIPRKTKREEIGVDPNNLPFHGADSWTHYEVSWLNAKGKPMVAIANISYDCTSPNIIESKSLKLYFNSLNNSIFESKDALEKIITEDLSSRLETPVDVQLHLLHEFSSQMVHPSFDGKHIDQLDVTCDTYIVNPDFLSTSDETVEEILCSDLLKSNCLVTHQPDWGSVQIHYHGPKINREGLLKYIVSFRNHDEFHEQCIERIFIDIMKHCQPVKLTVYGRYTRRGGIDINPFRSTEAITPPYKERLIRQ